MNMLEGFSAIVPYLTHPLALCGFVLLLFFSVHKSLIKSGILPTVTKKDGSAIVRLLLKYGFIIAVLIIVLGFFFAHFSKDRQGGDVTQKTGCGPAINNVEGPVTITGDTKCDSTP